MPDRIRSRRRRRSREWDERRARRRIELLDAADRVIRRLGPDASMDGIAAEAGIAKPILYRHFGDKGGLYQALAERYTRALMEELRATMERSSDPRERIAATIDTYLAFVEREAEAYRFLVHRAMVERPEAQATVADFVRQVAGEIAVAMREGLLAAGRDAEGAEPWAHGIVGMVQLAGDWWMTERSMARERVVEYLTSLLWGGFLEMARASRPPEREGSASA
jgi:AcrR family transcriptional regulator